MSNSNDLRTYMCGATVKPFNGSNVKPATEDKNGFMPVILDIFAGEAPDTRVLSGTVAKNMGVLTENDTANMGAYLFTATEIPPSEDDIAEGYTANRWIFSVVKELTVMDILATTKQLGTAKLVEVEKNVTVGTSDGIPAK